MNRALAPAGRQATGRPWGRRIAAVMGIGVIAAVSGCYGPIEEHERTIELDCVISTSSGQTSAARRTFTVRTALPQWTDPGGGTPIRVGAGPVNPEFWETISGNGPVTLTGEGIEGDLSSFYWEAPAEGLVVTAARGDEVVLSFGSYNKSQPIPGSPPTLISQRCVPAPGEDPVIGRIPVREAPA